MGDLFRPLGSFVAPGDATPAEPWALEVWQLASMLPKGETAIHHLVSIYKTMGTQDALAVTQIIMDRTETVVAQAQGFVRNSNTAGFRPELTDPSPHDRQTNHFLGTAAWALNGTSLFEYAAGIGHELDPSRTAFLRYFQGVVTGAWHAREFRDVVESLELDPNGMIDYAALDKQFEKHGWPAQIHEYTHFDDSILGAVGFSGEPLRTGCSMADLRCTVAGIHFGRLLAGGFFQDAEHAARWLERNVLTVPPHADDPKDETRSAGLSVNGGNPSWGSR